MRDDELPDGYAAALSGRPRPPSALVALLEAEAPEPLLRPVVDPLAALGFDVAGLRVLPRPAPEAAVWTVELDPLEHAGGGPARVWLEPTAQLAGRPLEGRLLSDDERARAEGSAWSIGVELTFGERPLQDYHRQLRLLAAAAPRAAVVLDINACRALSGAWLREAAAARVPPAPSHLFTIHGVFDEDDPQAGLWLHSHGLRRCGSIELEMLGVPSDGAGLLGDLLNATAGLFLDQGVAPPGEPVLAGKDLPVLWLPWQVGVREARPASVGPAGWEQRDEHHRGPSGVLFAPGHQRLLGLLTRRPRSPAALLPTLRQNPLLYVPSAESERMGLLATERMSHFLALQERFAGQERWSFRVKLGYPTDGARGASDREHLWFEVHGAASYTVDATLLNEPYGIARMHQGDRGRHSLEWTSSWQVSSPHGVFDPDTILHLERLLTEV